MRRRSDLAYFKAPNGGHAVAVVIDAPLQHEWEMRHHLRMVQQHARAMRSHGYELPPRVLLDLLVLAASAAQSLKDINQPTTGPDWGLICLDCGEPDIRCKCKE